MTSKKSSDNGKSNIRSNYKSDVDCALGCGESLLVLEGLDWVETGGTVRWERSEEYADEDRG